MTAISANTRLEHDDRRELLLTMIRAGGNDLRERALRIGAETLPESMLVSMLRDEEDDVVRNAGLEMLKLRGRRSSAAAMTLLEDGDTDVILQGVLLVDAIGDPRAWVHLRPLLQHEDENIVQAVITAAGHLGSRATAVDILPFLDRGFWLQLAALAALGNLRSRLPVARIAALLPDADLRDAAAEALARIGGVAAARALSDHWRENDDDLDAQQWLPLLAQALAEAEASLRVPDLRARLAPYLDSSSPEVAAAAAASLLSLGAGEDDGRALDVLAANAHERAGLPPCLARRFDLAEWLIAAPQPQRDWGYEIVRRDPAAVRPDVVRRCLVESPPDDVGLLTAIATRVANSEALVRLHARTPAAHEALAPLLRQRRVEVLDWVRSHPELAPVERVLLLDAAGAPAKEIIASIDALDGCERAAVVGQIRTRTVLARLPWQSWIAADAAVFAPLLGDVVVQRGVRDLLPLVRAELLRDPQPELIAAAGALRDRGSVQLVIDALAHCAPSARAVAFETIASIGGRAARNVLRQYATTGDRADVRLAARAMAQHATGSDGELLRSFAAHPDWAVRYAAAESLGRFPSRENLTALAVLAADPAALVAQRARAWLDAVGGNA